MESNIRLSVIVPVYNVAPYLRACIESLLHGVASDSEIILIDDGSTDECPSICDEYASRISQVKVQHQLNAGLSAARNTGLGIAKGRYISFIDSDDMASSTIMNGIVDLLEKTGADFAVTDYLKIPFNTSKEYYKTIKTEWKHTEMDASGFLEHIDTYSLMVWNKIFRRETIQGFEYPVGAIYEDVSYMCNVLERTRKIIYVPTTMNYYRVQRPGSMFSSKFSEWRYKGFVFFDTLIELCNKKMSQAAYISACRYAADFFQLQYIEATMLADKKTVKDMYGRYRRFVGEIPFRLLPLYRFLFRLSPSTYTRLKILKQRLCNSLRK